MKDLHQLNLMIFQEFEEVSNLLKTLKHLVQKKIYISLKKKIGLNFQHS
jgi:hypothetical protein